MAAKPAQLHVMLFEQGRPRGHGLAMERGPYDDLPTKNDDIL
jgi:hypothetical protein